MVEGGVEPVCRAPGSRTGEARFAATTWSWHSLIYQWAMNEGYAAAGPFKPLTIRGQRFPAHHHVA